MALNPHLPFVHSLSGIGIMPILKLFRSAISSFDDHFLLTTFESPSIEKFPPTILNPILSNLSDKRINILFIASNSGNEVTLPIHPTTTLPLSPPAVRG